MTTEEQIKLIGLDKLVALDRLKVLLPKFHITGSISLLWHSVISRAVGDIDIVVDNMDYIIGHKDIHADFHHDYEAEQQGDSIVMVKGKIPNQARMTISGIEVCVFYSTVKEELKEIDLFGHKHIISHPIHSILAKQRYVDGLNKKPILTPEQKNRRDKHQKDIDAFISWCNS